MVILRSSNSENSTSDMGHSLPIGAVDGRSDPTPIADMPAPTGDGREVPEADERRRSKTNHLIIRVRSGNDVKMPVTGRLKARSGKLHRKVHTWPWSSRGVDETDTRESGFGGSHDVQAFCRRWPESPRIERPECGTALREG